MQPIRPGVEGALDALLPIDDDAIVVDLGCGTSGGFGTVGIDRPSVVSGIDRSGMFVAGDLEGGVAIASGSVDAVVCHNVLECLARPDDLLGEAARVLRPRGIALWSHTEFDALVVNTADADLGRRVIHAYADHVQSWMPRVDGRMGRKLPGLVRRSGLVLDEVHAHAAASADRTGSAAVRIEEIVLAVGEAVAQGTTGLTLDDLLRWSAEVDAAEVAGDFLLAEITVIAVSHRP